MYELTFHSSFLERPFKALRHWKRVMRIEVILQRIRI